MATTIRLQRGGKKNAPAYKIIVTNSRNKRDGKFIEILGHFNPTVKTDSFKMNEERYTYWRSTGAGVSDAVAALVKGEYKYDQYDPKGRLGKRSSASEKREERGKTVTKSTATTPAEVEQLSEDVTTEVSEAVEVIETTQDGSEVPVETASDATPAPVVEEAATEEV